MTKVIMPYPNYYSLGVEYVAAKMKHEGHDVELFEYRLPDSYSGMKSKFDPKRIAQGIMERIPDIVAFSCVTDIYRNQLEIGSRLSISILKLWGGVHVTAAPDVVKGQGYPVDEIFIGDYTDITEYFPHKFKKSYPDYNIITSIGCPYHCSFCFNSQEKKPVKRRSPAHVIEELKKAKKDFNAKRILFLDDCYTVGNWLFDFLPLYERDIGLPFGCITSLSTLTKEKVNLLEKSGCINVQIGVQTWDRQFSEEVMDRKFNFAHIYDGLKMLCDSKIMIQVDHMFGCPGDTVRNHEIALMNYSTLKPDTITTFWLKYYPGTKITRYLTEPEKERITNGYPIRNRSYVLGGDSPNIKPFLGLAFIMNWIKYIPRWLMPWIVDFKLYKLFNFESHFLGVALPRLIQGLTNPKDFRARSHIKRFIKQWLKLS